MYPLRLPNILCAACGRWGSVAPKESHERLQMPHRCIKGMHAGDTLKCTRASRIFPKQFRCCHVPPAHVLSFIEGMGGGHWCKMNPISPQNGRTERFCNIALVPERCLQPWAVKGECLVLRPETCKLGQEWPVMAQTQPFFISPSQVVLDQF